MNCFQITTLVEDSQGGVAIDLDPESCELLSDYYFSRRFTGYRKQTHRISSL